ncbi:CPBP family intramembrane glutamic endopeptidase, partial [Microcoleus sp. S13_B4]|uniref:CPBP family intramembrane glutamic endopeptidase n=1 Tax=Microcoleus sp. S13_B4 TaxID=3055408 RepID=UPI002FD1471F
CLSFGAPTLTDQYPFDAQKRKTGMLPILMPGTKAIFLSSLFFTIHHIFVIAAYSHWQAVLLGSLAVFAAGIIWSHSYLTYRSLWPSYISHAIADLGIASIGWQILFN